MLNSKSSKHRIVWDQRGWWYKWVEIEWRWLESKLWEVGARIEMGFDSQFCLDWPYLSFIWGKFEETIALALCWNLCWHKLHLSIHSISLCPTAPYPRSDLSIGRSDSDNFWAVKQNVTSQYLCYKSTFSHLNEEPKSTFIYSMRVWYLAPFGSPTFCRGSLLISSCLFFWL